MLLYNKKTSIIICITARTKYEVIILIYRSFFASPSWVGRYFYYDSFNYRFDALKTRSLQRHLKFIFKSSSVILKYRRHRLQERKRVCKYVREWLHLSASSEYILKKFASWFKWTRKINPLKNHSGHLSLKRSSYYSVLGRVCLGIIFSNGQEL